MRKYDQTNCQQGFVAITTVLVILAIVVTLVISIPLLSIDASQISLSSAQKNASLNLVEGCTEEALLYLRENSSLPSSVTLPEGTCSVSVDSQSGTNWTFTVTGTFNQHQSSIQVSAVRFLDLSITSWLEI